MSKRTRGSRRAAQRRQGNRPQQPRAVRATTAPPVTDSPASVELADERVDERRSGATEENASDVRSAPNRSRARPSALLAARAATEYVYVAQDVRRIAAVAALLFGTMLVLWVLIVVARVIPV